MTFLEIWIRQFWQSFVKWIFSIYYQRVDDKSKRISANLSPRPTSVNYHFTRQCNYKCGFCFHTAKSSFVLPLEEAMRGLRLLHEAGKNELVIFQ